MFFVGRRVRFLTMQAYLLLSILVTSVVVKYDPVKLDNATMIRQVYYMFDNTTTPATG